MSETLTTAANTVHRFENVDPHDKHCVECILQLTRCLAYRRFAGCWDREERVNDAVSVAWEFAQKGKGTPATVAYFALRRVASNGQFSRSTRSIDHSQPGRSATRQGDYTFSASECDPVLVGMTKCDFEAWIDRLPERLQRVGKLLATGLNTVEVAESLGCTRGNVSGIRQQLIDDYRRFRNRT